VPIDFPDFNLRLAARARRAEVPVVYFVSPSVWAWRRGRLRGIKRDVRRMLVLYPFEVPFYEDAGVPVTFVGHPAVESASARGPGSLRSAGLEPGVEAVALLPGSRVGEVGRMLEPMLAAASILRRRRRHLHLVVPRATTVPEGWIEAAVARAGVEGVHVVAQASPELLAACTAGVVASGTATLEAALAGLASVVVYRLHPLTYVLARLLVRVDHVALPNLVLGRRVLPELIQSECTPERIAASVEAWLDHPEEAEAVRQALRDLPERLGGGGAFERAAQAVLEEARGVDEPCREDVSRDGR
jgi:lipid-A-disaccharide synthase